MNHTSNPTDPYAISPGWLTSLLRGLGMIEAASVESLVLRPMPCSVSGIGLAGVSLSYDLHEAGTPRALMAAYSDPDPSVRRLHHGLGNYVRVVRQLGDAMRGATEALPCLCAHMDADTGAMLILLGDPSWQPLAGHRLLDTFQRLSAQPAAHA